MKKKSTGIILSILGVLSLVLITAGVTYAFFNYARTGSTENTVTTGSITFLYTENTGVGKGISLTNAFPISDGVGKQQVGDGNVFDFKVTSTTPNKTAIPYEITARKSSDSTLDESVVKLYLTKVNSGIEEEVLLSKYSELTPTTKVDSSKYTEKTIYQGKVPSNSTSYEQAFRLRMWIDENTKFSPNADGTYLYNGKTFKVTVNVYANAKIVTNEEIALENSTNLSSFTINGVEAKKVEGQNYDYKIGVAEGTTSITINTETENPKATVTVEKIDSLAYSNTKTTTVKRLSTSKTFDLTEGDNYFKVTVKSENGQNTKEYKLKVYIPETVSLFGKQFEVIENAPTLTTSSNNTSDASGLYKSTATNFNGVEGTPTYYFRGNVENNYVSFAGQTWRIVRINEDGTIRMIMANGINNATYEFNSNYNNYSYMYYSNSNAKTELETWYTNNIASNENYVSKVASGNYFCEQAKAKYSSSWTSGSASMTVYSSYTPDFRCVTDGNGKGLVNASIGLITYDEVVYAGGYFKQTNSNYYLYNNTSYWTMSPAGVINDGAKAWYVYSAGNVNGSSVNGTIRLRAVLNLKADTAVTGSGTSTDPWIVG